MITWQTYYRPHHFGQLQLTDVRDQMTKLQHDVAFPKVLLFAGPKGTGKTSTSRIIAALLNTKANAESVQAAYLQSGNTTAALTPLVDPDTTDPEVVNILNGNSYAVVELDAASHRGIDDVRALQEQVYLPPTLSPVLVYILDEVHMFTPEAFNALLKILEEPPAHAFFILATTERHKIPATITSRCHIVNFRRATESELTAALKRIVDDQKLTADPAAIQELVTLADGSFRDAVKYLQTVSQQGDITLDHVRTLLVGTQDQQLTTLTTIILKKDNQQLIDFFADLRQLNVSEDFFLKNFATFLYHQLTANLQGQTTALTATQTKFLLDLLLRLPASNFIPYLNLELALLEVFGKSKKVNPSKKSGA